MTESSAATIIKTKTGIVGGIMGVYIVRSHSLHVPEYAEFDTAIP